MGRVPFILLVSFLAGPVIYLLGIVSYGWGAYMVIIVLGMSMFIRMPATEAYIISHTSERNRSTVLGVYYLCSRGGPGLIMPLMGYFFDRAGFSYSFAVTGAILLLVSLGCAAFLRGSRN